MPISPDMILAHEALATPGLIAMLGDGFGWDPKDSTYARLAQQEHTARVLSVPDPTKETLLVSERATLERLSDGEIVSLSIRQEILNRERTPRSLVVLDPTGDTP
ncbi:hypothetical protein [Psychromicrobium sp. YIM B11713]|uniref:hypothetical protein n=1 Tax=Psychromicrobium sp. YIM B11713 TaxID=3145233 RepID=UPI00374ECA67